MCSKHRLLCLAVLWMTLAVTVVETRAAWYDCGGAARGVAGCASLYQSCAGFYSSCQALYNSDCGSCVGDCVAGGRRLESDWSDDPSIWFEDGLYLYRNGRYYEAIGRLQYAAANDPSQAKYHYFLALAQWQVGMRDEALDSVQKGVELEREAPIESWGRMMERYQGYGRVWLDDARRNAFSQPAVEAQVAPETAS